MSFLVRGCLRSIFQYGLKINCRRNKGLKPLVYIDLWGVQSSNFGFSDILLGLSHGNFENKRCAMADLRLTI